MRMACDRPEMLHLSLESEVKARQRYKFTSDLLTLFIIDEGDNTEVIKLAEKYPFKKEIIIRDKKFGLTKNILGGMQTAFSRSDDYIIYIEDDILLHETFFVYLDAALTTLSPDEFTVLLSYSSNNAGNVNKVVKKTKYSSIGSLIQKSFFQKYISPHIHDKYYKTDASRAKYIVDFDNKYKKYWEKSYRYATRVGMHNEQAGLINRLVDIAAIEEGKYSILPLVSRSIHIGFYGKNRPGSLTGTGFDERLQNLRNIFSTGDSSKIPNSGKYNDYQQFSYKLEDWSGKIII